MAIEAIPPPKVRDYRLDLLHGFANCAIFLDHIPNNAVNWLTQRNYGFSVADVCFHFGLHDFFRLRPYDARSWLRDRASTRLVERSWQIYVAHVMLFVIYLAELGYRAAASGCRADNLRREGSKVRRRGSAVCFGRSIGVAQFSIIRKLLTSPRPRTFLRPIREGTMLQEFKTFALKGNVVDLAVGVIIGAAFGAIVASMVGDIIMPVIGAVTGGLDFSNYYLPLSSTVKTGLPLVDAKKAGAVLAYGSFLTVAINFLIIAFVLFLAIQGMNKLKKKEEAKPVAAPAPTASEALLTEIRDLLAKRA